MAASFAGVPHVWRLGGHVGVGSGASSQADERLTLEMIRLLSRAIVCNSSGNRSVEPQQQLPSSGTALRSRTGAGGDTLDRSVSA